MIGYYKEKEFEIEVNYSIQNDSFNHEFGMEKMNDHIEIYEVKVLANKTGCSNKRLLEIVDYDKVEKSILE